MIRAAPSRRMRSSSSFIPSLLPVFPSVPYLSCPLVDRGGGGKSAQSPEKGLATAANLWHNEGTPPSPGGPMCSGIEVVITGLTRNQFAGNRTWVRIPPAAPARRKRHIACDELFPFRTKLIARPSCRPPARPQPAGRRPPKRARRIRAGPSFLTSLIRTGGIWRSAGPPPPGCRRPWSQTGWRSAT